MTRHPQQMARRSAFTLIEVVIALAIGLLLLAALYVALDLQSRMAQIGRDTVQQSTLVRSLFTRVGTDITASLAPPDPSRFLSSSSSGSQGNSSGGQNGSSTNQASSNQSSTGQNTGNTNGTG